jgi:cell division protein FtsN
MAKRKKRRSTRRRSTARKQQSYPGWLWMLFGLAIGLSVAFAIYVKDNEPVRPQATSVPSSIDNNGESTIPASATPEPEVEKKEKRFTFYDLLPAAEFVVPEKAPSAEEENVQPEAIVEPGVYVLQAGSFSTHTDAERRRAQLGLQGIESHIQRVTVNDREYHRVYVGPTDDLDELNMLRSRLRAAKIDVLRIRLSD